MCSGDKIFTEYLTNFFSSLASRTYLLKFLVFEFRIQIRQGTPKGGSQSSVYLSAPTILRPLAQIQSTTCMVFQLIFELWCEKGKNKQKESKNGNLFQQQLANFQIIFWMKYSSNYCKVIRLLFCETFSTVTEQFSATWLNWNFAKTRLRSNHWDGIYRANM